MVYDYIADIWYMISLFSYLFSPEETYRVTLSARAKHDLFSDYSVDKTNYITINYRSKYLTILISIYDMYIYQILTFTIQDKG